MKKARNGSSRRGSSSERPQPKQDPADSAQDHSNVDPPAVEYIVLPYSYSISG